MTKNVLLIGLGPIGKAYFECLRNRGCNCTVVGRVARTERVVIGGMYEEVSVLTFDMVSTLTVFDVSIVAVPIVSSFEVVKFVVNRYKTVKVLVEKPVSLSRGELVELSKLAKLKNIKIGVLLNRRYLPSVAEARRMIGESPILYAALSFNESVLEVIQSSHVDIVKEGWLYANSVHVIDLFFNLIGRPRKLNAVKISPSKDRIDIGNSLFYGTGISDSGVKFGYFADWRVSGRWSIMLKVSDGNIFLGPLEELLCETRGESEKLTYNRSSKPGFTEMIDSELFRETEPCIPLEDYLITFEILEAIANGRTY